MPAWATDAGAVDAFLQRLGEDPEWLRLLQEPEEDEMPISDYLTASGHRVHGGEQGLVYTNIGRIWFCGLGLNMRPLLPRDDIPDLCFGDLEMRRELLR